MSELNCSRLSSTASRCARTPSAARLTRAFSARAALARSSRSLSSASSALSCQPCASRSSASSLRAASFLSAIARAAAERTSTSVSSISWIMRRTIFSGSSALSSMALMFELTMSVKREKIPIALFLSNVAEDRRALESCTLLPCCPCRCGVRVGRGQRGWCRAEPGSPCTVSLSTFRAKVERRAQAVVSD